MITIIEMIRHEEADYRISGNKKATANRVAPLDQLHPNSIIFVTDKLGKRVPDALVSSTFELVVICTEAVAHKLSVNPNLGCIITQTPRLTFMKIIAKHFNATSIVPGIHPTACVDIDAKVDPSATIMAYCVIGAGCTIGRATVIHPHVTIYPNCSIGSHITIHSGTVIGADGFGYERAPDGSMTKFPHLGGVSIEDDVEIGSNTSIDRGSLGDTIIRRGVKIDNQVHISHNCDVGAESVIIAHSMIGGSVKIGERAWLAPASIIMNQIRIGADALVGMGAVVTKDVSSGATVMGSPASLDSEFRAARSALRRLAKESIS